MTIDEAIKNLTPLLDPETTPLTYSETEATKLLIEAGKRIQNARDIGYSVPATMLPGETDNRDEQELDERRLDALLSKRK